MGINKSSIFRQKIRRYLWIIPILLLSLQADSKNSEETYYDSLIQRIPLTAEDTNKLKLYERIFKSEIYLIAEHSEKYVQPAVQLAEKLHWHVHPIKAWAGRVYWKLGKRDLALKYHFEALKLVDRKKDPKTYGLYTTFIGQDYCDGGNFSEALKYFIKAGKIFESIDDQYEIANMDLFISWAYTQQGNFVGSARSNLDALRRYEQLKENYGIAVSSANLAGDYIQLGKYSEALQYLTRSSSILLKVKDYVNLANNYLSLAEININLKNYPEALRNITTALFYGKKINDKAVLGDALSKQADIYLDQHHFEEAVLAYESAIEHFREANYYKLMADNYNNLAFSLLRLSKSEKAREALDSAEKYSSRASSPTTLSGLFYGRQLMDSFNGNWKGAYLNHYRYVSIRDSIFNDENRKKILQTQLQYEFDKKEASLKAEQEKNDLRQRNIRNSIVGALAGTLIFLVVVYRQRNKIARARKRSDELLLNILPEETAEELKSKGTADAKHFDVVTVMFTDFKGFTQIAEKLTPAELVHTIHECYIEFDSIITKYGIEKIKTIGDSYMCAGGLPVENKSHAKDVVQAALEIQKYMLRHQEERRSAGKEVFEIRIGIHTGPVVAGIVGIKKFAYDIWGDTVNIASRMESSGEVGKVNISGATYELVKDKFNCTYRGRIQAKNKGEIDMYFVDQAL